jgi:predicted nucleic acid-binding protein
MNVALDANILIADLWLRSQRTRQLFDYLAKTRSHILLHHVVEAETRAYARRHIMEIVSGVEKNLRSAERRGIVGLPPLDVPSVQSATIAAWEKQFDRVFNRANTLRLDLDGGILPEAVRRATERVAPCSDSGNGMRDTLIWLGLLKYATKNPENTIAFISMNTNDFADASNLALHPTLSEDCAGQGVTVSFFADLDSFLRAHAEPVAFVTPAWVRERLRMEDVARIIEKHIELWGSGTAYSFGRWSGYGLRPIDERLQEYYRPVGKPVILTVHPEFSDVFVWRFDNNQIELQLTFDVYMEAEILCERENLPPYYEQEVFIPVKTSILHADVELDQELLSIDDILPPMQTLLCGQTVTFELAAKVCDDKIELLGSHDQDD